MALESSRPALTSHPPLPARRERRTLLIGCQIAGSFIPITYQRVTKSLKKRGSLPEVGDLITLVPL